MAKTTKRNKSGTRTKSKIKSFFGDLFRKLLNALISAIRKNPGRAFVIFLICIVIILIAIAIAVRPAEQIDSSAYSHAPAFDNCIVADGIDVSYAQGSVDWKAAKKIGIDFAFIRAGFRDTGEGNLHVDERFEENMHAAKRAGMAVGVYYFSQATSVAEAKEEANALMELIAPYQIDLPLIMDYEKSGDGRLTKAISEGKLDSKKLGRIVRAWTGTVEDAGYDSGLYANYDFLTHTLNGSALSETTNVWTAQYNTYAQFEGKYSFWQCSSSMQIDATESTHVDHDFWYIPERGVWPSNASNADERKSIDNCRIETKRLSYRYMGHNVEPRLKIKDGFRRLRKGRDYTVTYIDNTAPGKGYAVIRGIGRYKDTVAVSYLIKSFLFF